MMGKPATLTAIAVAQRLAHGDKLHMELCDGLRQWWFEAPHALVADATIMALMTPGTRGRAHLTIELVEAGDSLFGLPLGSQTWLTTEGAVQ